MFEQTSVKGMTRKSFRSKPTTIVVCRGLYGNWLVDTLG